MTEAEWLACGDPVTMLRLVPRRCDERRRLLFKAAYCRHIWRFLTSRESRRAVVLAEAFADGQIGETELAAAAEAAWLAADGKEPQ